MAALLKVKLSKYAEQLSVSDKRRYLEKIEELGDEDHFEETAKNKQQYLLTVIGVAAFVSPSLSCFAVSS